MTFDEFMDQKYGHEQCPNDPLPEWAIGKAFGKFVAGAQLQTKDGRKIGNAYLADWGISAHDGNPVARVITDAGNVVHFNYTELSEYFFPPELIMVPLPIHSRIIMEEDLNEVSEKLDFGFDDDDEDHGMILVFFNE